MTETSTPSVGFDPKTPESERPKTHALGWVSTGTEYLW